MAKPFTDNATVLFLGPWRDQYIAEQTAWIKAANPKATAEAIQGYQSGLKQGWIAALNQLKLHGYVAVASIEQQNGTSPALESNKIAR